MNSIDNLIMLRVSTNLGFQNYIGVMQVCEKLDAAIMSTRSGAKHSRNPQHYYRQQWLSNQVRAERK